MKTLSRIERVVEHEYNNWAVDRLFFSRDSAFLLVLLTMYDGLYLINTTTQESRQLPIENLEKPLYTCDISADGQQIMITTDKSVRFFDLTSFQEVRRLASDNKGGYLSAVFNDSQTLMLAYKNTNDIELWDIITGQLKSTIKIDAKIFGVALNSHAPLVAVGCDDNTVQLWNYEQSTVEVLQGHEDDIDVVAFSPDGTLLASASADESIMLWSVSTGKLWRTLKLPRMQDAVTSVAFHPGGKLLAATYLRGQDPVIIWNIEDGSVYETLPQPFGEAITCAFSPDGKLLATGGRNSRASVLLWKIEN